MKEALFRGKCAKKVGEKRFGIDAKWGDGMSRISLVKNAKEMGVYERDIIENYDSSGLVEQMEQLVGSN